MAITSVNGIIPPGQAAPDRVRVTGTASQCVAGQVVVSTSLTSSGTATVAANGRYRVELPINTTPIPACGDQISVQVQCSSDPTCFAVTGNRPLQCCTLTALIFQAVRPAGSLTPTDLRVQGVLLGCPTDEVVVSSTVTATTGPIAVDPYTGGFVAVLPLTATVQCDDKIAVTAACASGTGCVLTVSGALECPACYGSSVVVTLGPCTGTPPVQPVTFSAQIAIPATSRTFYWDFGDGSTGPQFTILNPAPGTSATPHPHVETHNYAAGTWTARLHVVGPPFECDEFSVGVVTSCDGPPCPTVTVGPAVVAANCVNGKRSVTLPSTVVVPPGPSGAVLQWDYGDGTFGPAIVVSAGTTTSPPQTHAYAPGTYTARLTTVQPTGCPDVPVAITVPGCGCTLQIQSLTTQVGPCDPATGQRVVTATVALTNADPADLFYWQWDPSIPATTGIPASMGGTSQQHSYIAPGTGQTPVTVSVVVERGTGCVAAKSANLLLDGCGTGCPSISSLIIGAPGMCTADRLRRTVTLDATISGGGVTGYTWDCGDGTTIPLGSAGPQTTHDFLPGTYVVRLTTTGPGACTATAAQPVTIDACCPEVTGLTASPGTCAVGATVRPVTLTAAVAGSGVTSYMWSFGDGSPDITTTAPVAPPHDYPPGSYTATVRTTTPACPDSTATTTFSVAACTTNGGGGSISCAVLLWIAMFLILVGAILAILGCILSDAFPQGGLVLEIIGAVLFLLGWLLFGLWLLICSAFTACAVILAVRTFVMALIVVFAGAAAVLAILALLGITFLWPCAAMAAVAGLNWGLVLTILDKVAEARGCLIVNPSGGSSSARAGRSPAAVAATTANPGTAGTALSAAYKRPQGMGDVVKSMTAAMGITPCAPCQERAAQLNRWMPLTDPRPPDS